MLAVERYDRLLPIIGVTEAEPRAARLALAVLNVHFEHGHLEQVLNRPLDVGLRGQAIHLERVRIAPRRAMHPLLRHQRLEDDLVRLKVKPSLLCNVLWHVW